MPTSLALEQAPVTSNADDMRLARWRSEFAQDFRAFAQWLPKKQEAEDFYDGKQWTAKEIAKLEARRQPIVVINLIKPRIDGVIGDFLGRRVMTRAIDRGSGDFETAKFVTEALRYVEIQNRFDDQEEKVASDQFVGGQGWYKANLEFDFLEPEIIISHRNNDDIVVDRNCRRRDLKDAKRLYETVWVEVEDLVELYPDFEQEIRNASAQESQQGVLGEQHITKRIGDQYAEGNNTPSGATGFDFQIFNDPKRKRVRVINIWERIQKRVLFAFHPDIEGTVTEVTDFSPEDMAALKANYPGVQFYIRKNWQLNSGIFIVNKILEFREDVRPHDSEGKFPFARAVGHFDKRDNMPYGLARQYIDPQREYNKRRSKLLHKSNVNRVIADQGAVEDKEEARREVNRPDGYVEKRQGYEFTVDNSEPAQADVYMLELAQAEIERSGVSREFIGQENKVLSGRAINLRQLDGQKMLRPFYAGLRAARRDIFSIVLEEIQQYWTSEKLIKITDDPDAQGVILNQRVTDPDTGEAVIINDLRLGKYDITIDESAETPNQRQENFRILADLMPAITQSGQPFPVEELIEASDLPNKRKLIEKITAEKQRQLEIAQAQLIAQANQAGAAP